MLALAAQRGGLGQPVRTGIDDAHIAHPALDQATHAGLQSAERGAQHRSGCTGDHGQRALQRHAVVLRPLERQAQQQLQPGGSGFGLGKRQGLGVLLHRRVVGHQRVDGAVAQCGTQGIAVALLAQRRSEASTAVEEADVEVREVQRVDAHIAAHLEPFGLGLTHQLDPGSTGEAAQVHARVGGLEQLKNGVQGNGLGRHGHAAQAQARGQRAAGGHALAQVQLLRAQPHGVAVGGGVLQRTLQHLGAGQRHIGLAEAHAARFGELGHFGEHLARQAAREGAQGEQARLVEFFRAELEHLHQTGLVEHRVGVRRADQAGDATGHGSGHFGFEHAFVLMPRLAQARCQVHQARQHETTRCVDAAVGRKVGRHTVDAHNAPRRQGNVAGLVKARGGVDHPAVLDQNFHDFKPNWPLSLMK